MKFCGKCGQLLSEDEKFCGNCGTKQNNEQIIYTHDNPEKIEEKNLLNNNSYLEEPEKTNSYFKDIDSPNQNKKLFIIISSIILIIILGVSVLLITQKPTNQYPTKQPITTKTYNDNSPVQKTNTPQKISTSTQTNTINNQTYQPIQNCSFSRIHVGDSVIVSLGGGQNSIRSAPDTHPSDNIIKKVPSGTVMLVIDGPKCSWGWLLWKVQLSDGTIGWTAESDEKNTEFWLTPLETKQICIGNLPSRLNIGDQAYVAEDPPYNNNLRAEANKNSELIGQIPPGGEITVLGSPQCSNDYTYYYVKVNNTGQKGWTAESNKSDSFYYLIPIIK